MANRQRNIQLKIWVNEEERKLIKQKMAQLPTSQLGAYMRKMAIDGYIIYTDIKNIKQYIQELQAIGKTSTKLQGVLIPPPTSTKRILMKSKRGLMKYDNYKDTSYQIYAKARS